MKCPKCGSIVEDGKEICFLCGANVNTFGKGGSAPMFSEYNPAMNEDYNRRKEEYNNRFNYRNVDINKGLKEEDKDIFDFYAENKTKIKVISLLVIGLVAVFALYKYLSYKTEVKPHEAVLRNLYYDVDDSFENVTSGQNEMVYVKSGAKGTDCSIMVSVGTSTSGDHVEDLYSTIKQNSASTYLDNDGSVTDQTLVPLYQDSQIKINGNTWYYLNAFYRATANSEYTLLKYRYLSSMFQGYYYDITLINNSNDATCTASLDRLARTLEFVES